MKNLFYCLLLVFISQPLFSQNCEKISPYKEGMKLEYTNYNKKGKETSIDKYSVSSVSNNNGNMEITIQSDLEDDSDASFEFLLKCVNGDFLIDMSNYGAIQGDASGPDFTLKAEGDFIIFPDNMNTGTELEDGQIALSVGGANSTTAIGTMSVLNRKVLESGSITTKAGTFDGHKLSFDYLFDMGILKLRGSGIEWYVPGIGIVKSESYSKKGKIQNTRELTFISQN